MTATSVARLDGSANAYLIALSPSASGAGYSSGGSNSISKRSCGSKDAAGACPAPGSPGGSGFPDVAPSPSRPDAESGWSAGSASPMTPGKPPRPNRASCLCFRLWRLLIPAASPNASTGSGALPVRIQAGRADGSRCPQCASESSESDRWAFAADSGATPASTSAKDTGGGPDSDAACSLCIFDSRRSHLAIRSMRCSCADGLAATQHATPLLPLPQLALAEDGTQGAASPDGGWSGPSANSSRGRSSCASWSASSRRAISLRSADGCNLRWSSASASVTALSKLCSLGSTCAALRERNAAPLRAMTSALICSAKAASLSSFDRIVWSCRSAGSLGCCASVASRREGPGEETGEETGLESPRSIGRPALRNEGEACMLCRWEEGDTW
eukprot:scaffold241583_cov30-Tisochrysis_lutea.AAC.5